MNLFKFFSFYAFVLLTVSAVTLAQVPIFPYPPDDGTKSYYVTGENGVNIFVEEKGDPKKTTILFSTGFLTSRISWDPQWFDPELYKNFHLVRYDYRGIGNSDKPTYADSYSLELNAADLSAIIGKLSYDHDFKNKKIALVGWSIGTPISLTFMKNYPDIKIDGFVSVCGIVNNTAGGTPDPKIAPLIQDFMNPQEIYSKVVYAIDGLFRLVSFKQFSDELLSIFLGIAVKAPFQYRTMTATPFSLAEFYSTLTIPTLHIIGKEDIVVTFDHSLYFASLKQNIKSIIYEEVGHTPPWENIKGLNEDLVKFVSEI